MNNNLLATIQVIVISFIGIIILALTQGIAGIWDFFDFYGLEYVLNSFTYIGLSYVCLKYLIEKGLNRQLSFFYIKPFQLKKEWLLIGVILPISVLVSLFILIPGTFSSNHHSLNQTIRTLFYAIFSVGIAPAFVEELIFRGLIMNAVKEKFNITIAIFVPSILFGLLHIFSKQGGSMLLVITSATVGIMFSLLTYFNRTIWASVIVHSLWNMIVIGGVVSFGIQKETYSISSYVFSTKNLLLTGGTFGVEISLFALIGYISVIIFLINKSKKQHKIKYHY